METNELLAELKEFFEESDKETFTLRNQLVTEPESESLFQVTIEIKQI